MFYLFSSVFERLQNRNCFNCPFADQKLTHSVPFIYGKTCPVNKGGEQKSWEPEEQLQVVLLQAELVQSTDEQKAGARGVLTRI